MNTDQLSERERESEWVPLNVAMVLVCKVIINPHMPYIFICVYAPIISLLWSCFTTFDNNNNFTETEIYNVPLRRKSNLYSACTYIFSHLVSAQLFGCTNKLLRIYDCKID